MINLVQIIEYEQTHFIFEQFRTVKDVQDHPKYQFFLEITTFKQLKVVNPLLVMNPMFWKFQPRLPTSNPNTFYNDEDYDANIQK